MTSGITHYKVPKLTLTPHPPWIEAMITNVAPLWRAAVNAPLFAHTVAGDLPPIEAWRRAMLEFFTIVEGFPKYMGLSLAKTTYGQRKMDTSVRRWLLQNIGIEARHAEWYIDWMAGLGLSPSHAVEATPSDEIRQLHAQLMQLCASETLAVGVAASNWAIEGITGEWSQAIGTPFRRYAEHGARIDRHSMMWLNAHARYDDAHPEEALEIIKLCTDPNSDEPARIEAVVRGSLELFVAAIHRCYPG